MRTVKTLAGLVGGIIALMVAGMLSVWMLVNPSDYKDRVAAAVREATGREFILNGDLKLSVFPWVALELGPATLGNPPGFGEEPFLTFEHATVRVKLVPLLNKRLEMERVELDGLDLRLHKNAEGAGNWENFGRVPEAAPGVPGGDGEGARAPWLAGLQIKNGRVSYPGYAVANLNLETGALGAQGDTPIRLSFDANRGVPDEWVSVSANFNVGAQSPKRRWRVAAVNLSGLLGRPGDDRPAHWELSAPVLELDLAGQTATAPGVTLSYSSVHLMGKLEATTLVDDLRVTGSVTLAPLVLREFAPRFGIALPRTRDPRALAQLSGSSDFIYGAGGLRLERLKAQLDDTRLEGSVALTGEPRAWKFELAADQINVDRYLKADSGPPQAGEDGPAGAGALATADGAVRTAQASPPRDADGTLTVASLHLSPLDFTNVHLTIASQDHVLHLFPALAQIDGGSYSGNITVDQRGPIPVWSLDEHLSGVDMGRLLAATSNKGRLSGRSSVNLKGTARGARLDAMMRTLNGHLDASLAGGALEGMDVGFELGRAQALIKRDAEPKRSNPPRTHFDDFKMSAEITGGVARTSDLIISSAALRLRGKGSANLVNRGIDLQMLASLSSPGLTITDIPFKITGTYTDPTVRPDVDALAKGQLRQKLQDVLKKNGLEGLFSR